MGVSIKRSVTAKAATYDLTTLPIVKDELSIKTTDTSNDSWLGRAITQVSAVCARYCNRQFMPEAVLETQLIDQDPYPYQTPGGVQPMVLTRWPVLAVISVVQTFAIANPPNAQGVTQTLTENVDFSVDYEKGQIYRLNPFTGVQVAWEAVPTAITYSAGYGALVTEQDTVPASTPFQITVANAATFSYDDGVSYSNGTALVAVPSNPAVGQYSINPATGVYTFNSGDANAQIAISYAYSSLPADLVDAVLRTITQRWYGKNRDPMQMSVTQPGLGENRFWVGAAPGQTASLPPEITGILDHYRMPVIG